MGRRRSSRRSPTPTFRSTDYHSRRESYYHRRRRSRSGNRRFSESRPSRDPKSRSYYDSERQTSSRSYGGGYDYGEPSSSNFYRYNHDDDDDYGTYDDYRSSYPPRSPSYRRRRPRYSSNSSHLINPKSSSHGSSRHCDRINYWSKYSDQSSPRPDSSCDYQRPQRWWSDRNGQRWRRRRSISPRYHQDEPSSLFKSYSFSHDHHQEYYRRRSNRPPSSPPRNRHKFPTTNPYSSPYYNHRSAASNHHASSRDGFTSPNSWRRSNCPTFSNYVTLNPSPSNCPPLSSPVYSTPIFEHTPGNSVYSDFIVPSPDYNPNTPRSCTPIFEHTPGNSVYSDFIDVPSPDYNPTTPSGSNTTPSHSPVLSSIQ